MDKYGTGQDPYCYPNSNILKNLLGIRAEAELESAERELTELAVQGLEFHEPPYDYAYLKLIHRTLFADIYEWAGKERTIDISKQGTRFCTATRIAPEINKLCLELKAMNYFVDLPEEELIKQAARFYSELNIIHPFRDGIGRCQRIMFEQILLNCGYSVSWDPISREEWLEANIAGYLGNNEKMVEVFRRSISGRVQES